MKLPITGDTLIEDVVRAYPKSVSVFLEFGIRAIVCGDVIWGTIKDEAERVGADLEKLLEALNKLTEERQIPTI
ncbi:hypothetical protein DRQ17_06250 [bacterium]|nr:MAG: hypothetical protein DRQ17_06250 [bacterium]